MQGYPLKPHVRRHGPQGFDRYQTYKPWLRDEFTFRCVYCLERETWYPNGHHGFGVDHIKPKGDSRYKHLECVYENLLYSCNRCNSAKGSEELLDPTQAAMGEQFAIDAEGVISGLTHEARFMIIVLGLDTEMVTSTRKRYIRIAKLYATLPNNSDVEELYFAAFGFPQDLPDLHGSRPTDNSRPEGRESCYYVQAAKGELNRVCVI